MGDSVKSTEVDTESKEAVLLFYKKDWSSEWRFGNSVLLVIESNSIMTVGRDIVGPIFLRMKSLKSLKAMLGKAANCGLATTCGMNNNARGNGAPNEVKTII